MSSQIYAGTSSGTALNFTADTSGTLVLQTGASPTTAVTIDSSQNVTIPKLSATTVTLPNLSGSTTIGFKNRIINGAMVIDQRNAGASVTSTGANFSVDRWQLQGSLASKYSAQQNAGSVTPPAGFKNYLGATSLSAYSVLSSDYFGLLQVIEGFNIADLNWGTANASTVTLSFWVRSSLTGTFGGSLVNGNNTRSYPFSYTISSANTWTQISVTIAGDTTGTWVTDNTAGIKVWFGLGAGSSFVGTANAWTGSGFVAQPTGTVSVVGTNGATFYITGVQLEVGSTATSFDYRPYGAELALCQRYFYTLKPSATSSAVCSGLFFTSTAPLCTVIFPIALRAAPTFSISSVSDFVAVVANGTVSISGASLSGQGTTNTRIDFTSGSSTAGQGTLVQAQTTTAALNFSAEL